jgi:hypothetical protein
MKHKVQINISKEAKAAGDIIRYRNVFLPARLLRWLTRKQHRMMVFIPGDSVRSVSIQELSEDGDCCDRT